MKFGWKRFVELGAIAAALGTPILALGATGASAAGGYGTPSAAQPSPGLARLSLEGDMRAFRPTTPVRPAADLPLLDGEGRGRTLADYGGRLIVLNFWATWCAPCVRELPSLNALQRQFDPSDVLVMPLSLDRGGARIAGPFMRRLGLDALDLYLDPKRRAFKRLGARVLPATFIIGPDGGELGYLLGPAEWDDRPALNLIRHYLEKTRPAG